MTDEFEEAERDRRRAYIEASRRALEEGTVAEEWPSRRWSEPKPQPRSEPKPAETIDWAVLDDRVSTIIGDVVGPAIDRIADRINGALDEEHDAVVDLKSRLRELEIKSSQQEAVIAELERRLVTADRRGGSTIDGSAMKIIN
jgi:hypothetical protein